MLASARRRACAAGYRLPAAARLRAICRAGDLARRKPRAAAAFPGGRERPPYILRQTNGKNGNGRPPSLHDRCSYERKPRCGRHPRVGADACIRPPPGLYGGIPLACGRPPAGDLQAGRSRPPKTRAAANSPGGRERPPYIRRQTCGKIENGRLPQSPRNEFRFRQNCTEPHTTPAQGRMLASARRRACAAGYRLPARRPPAGDLQAGRSRPPKTQRRRKLPRRA